MAFFTTAITTLKTLVCAIGAGLAAWGVINLLEGYGADNFLHSYTSLSHINKVTRNKTVDGGRWHRTDWNKPDSTACNFVWINKWVE